MEALQTEQEAAPPTVETSADTQQNTEEHTGTTAPMDTVRLRVTGNLCPQCGCNTMVYEEGCRKCYSCGHSEC